MTNWEKFKEVFGIPDDSKINTEKQMCAIIDCDKVKKCWECPLYEFNWEKEYKAKSLEQEPCEDSISREAVFETIDDCSSDGLKGIFCSYDDGERFKKYIKELPSVTPTQKWISTSEKLPRKNEYVGNVDKHYLIQDEFGDMQVAAYTNRGWIPIHTIGAFEYDVVAWQPLPEAYKVESEEEKE